ncbi:MAG: ATP-binding protein [Deltaproteobacteria bacterium]|jgi:hypothetical protein|nr:ATP-binding protein [Deltaproteobacteria bacterium]
MTRFPRDTSSFKDIIEDGYVYVDKTDFLYKILTGDDKNFFLSRPRRFGKSLFLDTIDEIFQGDENNFKDLKIGKMGYDFKKHPVLKFDMNLASGSPKELKTSILGMLRSMAEDKKVKLQSTSYDITLSDLIKYVYNKYEEKVVILIDEYDDPVSSHAENLTLAKKNAEVLRTFYSRFKSSNNIIRLAFVTGVTRYAMMGISTGFNHLVDLTLNKDYAAICGFTHHEMDLYFGHLYPKVLETVVNSVQYKQSRLLEKNKSVDFGGVPLSGDPTVSALNTEADLRDEILRWYDGYTWDGVTKVLNPVSLLYFFKTRSFDTFWNYSGDAESFLKNIFKSSPLSFTKDMLARVPKRDLTTVKVDELKPIPLLFQTGYLTVEKILGGKHEVPYSFKVPNHEIYGDYVRLLAKAVSNETINDINKEILILQNSISDHDSESLSQLFESHYSQLSAEQHARYGNETDLRLKEKLTEFFYSDIIFLYLRTLIGKKVKADEPGIYGNPDLTLQLSDHDYAIIEIKYAAGTGRPDASEVLNNLAKKALDAIKNKKYGVQYRKKGDRVTSIGMGIFGRGKVKIIFGNDENN